MCCKQCFIWRTKEEGKKTGHPNRRSKGVRCWVHKCTQVRAHGGGEDHWTTCIDVWPGTPCSLAWLVAGCNTLGGGSFRRRLVQLSCPELLNRLSKVNTSCSLVRQIFSFRGKMQIGGNSICLCLTGVLLWPHRRPPWTTYVQFC